MSGEMTGKGITTDGAAVDNGFEPIGGGLKDLRRIQPAGCEPSQFHAPVEVSGWGNFAMKVSVYRTETEVSLNWNMVSSLRRLEG
jgi:hypothetical protein